MDVDLPERAAAGVDERVRLVRPGDDDVAGAGLDLRAVDGERRLTLLDDEHLAVRVPVQRRASSRLGVDAEDRDGKAVLGADELVRDRAPGQLVDLDRRQALLRLSHPHHLATRAVGRAGGVILRRPCSRDSPRSSSCPLS